MVPPLLLAFACFGVSPSPSLLEQMAAQPLELTRHAQCRMKCRDITEAEVRQLLTDGHWVPERTRTDGDCPSHAVEGTSADGQTLRVVYAACADRTKVVTAIDLDEEHDCDDCP